MPKKKKIDNNALLKMIKDGVEQKEILEKFGFQTATQLKVAYANALMETGEVADIKGKGRRTKKKKLVDTKVTVNNRGSLIIPKVLVTDMKFEKGQVFQAKKTASGIQLKKVD